jgi:hypothetical protein
MWHEWKDKDRKCKFNNEGKLTNKHEDKHIKVNNIDLQDKAVDKAIRVGEV